MLLDELARCTEELWQTTRSLEKAAGAIPSNPQFARWLGSGEQLIEECTIKRAQLTGHKYSHDNATQRIIERLRTVSIRDGRTPCFIRVPNSSGR